MPWHERTADKKSSRWVMALRMHKSNGWTPGTPCQDISPLYGWHLVEHETWRRRHFGQSERTSSQFGVHWKPRMEVRSRFWICCSRDLTSAYTLIGIRNQLTQDCVCRITLPRRRDLSATPWQAWSIVSTTPVLRGGFSHRIGESLGDLGTQSVSTRVLWPTRERGYREDYSREPGPGGAGA